MIKTCISNARRETEIQFPIGEEVLLAKLQEAYGSSTIFDAGPRSKPQIARILSIEPKALSSLANRFCNMDELNFLARRMDSFSTPEMEQFEIGVSKLSKPSVKDLINLTYNLDKFTLVRDVGSYSKIGRAYMMNTNGHIPYHDGDDLEYAVIGKELVDKGLFELTEHGLLIYDPAIKLVEEYDGQTFPPYYDRADFLVSAEVSFNGHTELLLLPLEKLAIEKALGRLGAESIDDCSLKLEDRNITESFALRIESIIHKEGIFEANSLLAVLAKTNADLEKLAVTASYAEVSNAKSLSLLAERLDDFEFLPGVLDYDDVGRYLVENVPDFNLDPEMDDYFDFEGFGEHFSDEHDGQFIEGGFLCYTGYDDLNEILTEAELSNEDMTMGGM